MSLSFSLASVTCFILVISLCLAHTVLAKSAPARASTTDPRSTTAGLIFDQRFSFDGPYDGKRVPYFEIDGHTILPSDVVRLTTLAQSRAGLIRGMTRVPFTSWQLDFEFRISGSRNGADGLALWYSKTPLVVGEVYGAGPRNFEGIAVAFDTFDNDGSDDHPAVFLLRGDGALNYHASNDGLDMSVASCMGIPFRNSRFAVQASLTYVSGRLQLFVRSKPDAGWQECFDTHINLPAGYYFGFSASTGAVSDKHDLISAFLYNLAPGAEDQQVLAEAEHARRDFGDDVDAPPHRHERVIDEDDDATIDEEEEARKRAERRGRESLADDPNAPAHKHTEVFESDDKDAPPHKHVGEQVNPFVGEQEEHEHIQIQTKPFVAKVPFNDEQEGIASKNLAEAISDDEMVFFKWKKRFEKTRASLREVTEHDDDTDIEHAWEMPETGTIEPLFDESSAPEDVFELYDILAEELWVIKTMQYDTMNLIDQLQDLIRHQNEHTDEQHRVFADSMEKLLREVATRHTVQDALKEQLLRFELQKHDLHAMNKEFIGHMQGIKGEFDSVSHTVRAKVGAQQEILATQVKELQSDFRSLASTLSALTEQLQQLSTREAQRPAQRNNPYESRNYDDDEGIDVWYIVVPILVIIGILVAVFFIARRSKRSRNNKIIHGY